MGNILQDMSRVRPAPTVKRETSAMLASLALVIPFLAAVYVFLDGSRTLNAVLGGLLLLWILGRWAYVVVRGDLSAAGGGSTARS